MFQVQRQLQMRIEAQGKYLQKIIEEQQKLSDALKVSETSSQPADDNQNLSPLETPPDQCTGLSSPKKKQRLDDSSGPSQEPP